MTSPFPYYSSLDSQTHERGTFCLLAMTGLFVAAALGLMWRYEEPGKLVTLAVVLLVYLLGVIVIHFGRRHNIITNRSRWLLVFLIKLTICWFVTQYFWAAPLQPDLLRTPYQNVGLQDANTYDYIAARIAQEGFIDNVHLLWYTWLSFGIIAYLSTIYSVFGVSVFYVSMLNALLSLVGVLCLAGTMSILEGDSRKWQVLRFAMLIPFACYYDATPSKEPLTHALFYCTLLYVARLLARKGSAIVNAVGLGAALAMLAVVRVNVAVLLLCSNVVFFYRRVGLVKSLALTVVGILVFLASLLYTSPQPGVVAERLFSLDQRLERMQVLYVERTATGDTELKLAVGSALTPRRAVDLVLLAPVRLIIWMFLPYPDIIPDFGKLVAMPEMLGNDRRGYFRFPTDFFAQLSGIGIIAFSPYIVAGLRVRGRGWRTTFLVCNVIIPALAISNLMFIMGRRYRTLLEPLMLATAFWGLHYGKCGLLRYLMYGGFLTGLVAVAAYQMATSG